MADWEKVKKGLENCLKGFDCPPECPYLHDCHDLMKPMFVELAKDAYDLLNEQDYRTWIIDMFHKYKRDDLIALMVQKGEESILAGLLKEQEAVPVIQREVMHMLVWCCGSCGVAITDGDKYCRMCGRKMKWDG